MLRIKSMDGHHAMTMSDGRQIYGDGSDSFVAPINLVSTLSLASLRTNWLKCSGITPPTEPVRPRLDDDAEQVGANWLDQLLLSEVEEGGFDPDYSFSGPISIILTPDGRLAVRVLEACHADITSHAVARALDPMLRRHHATLLRIATEGSGRNLFWEIDVEIQYRRKTVSDAYSFGKAMQAILTSLADNAGLNYETTWNLLLSGNAELLIGLEESSWLEVKSQPYDLDDESNKVELAQDVSRFANSEQGGLLIIGIRTRRKPDGETLSKLSPSMYPPNVLRRYRDVIDRRIHPPIDGLEIDKVAAPRGELICIKVPSQPEELKPFLVHGAIVAGKYEGAFISIVRRRGEHSIPATGPAIHSMLAAGRALLRGKLE